jgi:hypothetical protein
MSMNLQPIVNLVVRLYPYLLNNLQKKQGLTSLGRERQISVKGRNEEWKRREPEGIRSKIFEW